MTEMDRKERLVSLRKNRSKKGEAANYSQKTSDQITLYTESDTLKNTSCESIIRPEETTPSLLIQFPVVPLESEKNSLTKDIKDDLARYYQEANLRTSEVLDRIIREKVE
ncbi:hypothetical protein FOB58_002955 [Candida parapsilosis]|uniref:Uncharacterized protein n=2 Tax=Candida parapsilosis TaxID=5480 RepID=G8B7E2_CANPC|nr:uncharacterized protein CPAR2_104135 [Candida parapsilosis]KAF6048356.1 hypothetical protein FOB59_003398 [Candida parapsilosis]KAF6049678.1 hypothetical protein FOB58_002955 [Candida parapsilosis]KAF6057540.1 hypothetical protein FOB60_002095 [Candida parapsilosis]KAF6065752.1 hypothetical protein FOB61_001822 [Candida parapsilosis]CAD1809727.1 unnamed protein product [Candida parapsilosis]